MEHGKTDNEHTPVTTTYANKFSKLSNFHIAIGVSFLILILILIAYFIRYRITKVTPPKQIASVVSTIVQNKQVPILIAALGNVVATYTVTIKTQINGFLMKVLYQEGQLVKIGDKLAEIDERLLLAQLAQYEGQLIRDKALLDNALIDFKRYQVLWKQNSISEQTLATQKSLVKQYEGDVATDKGLIETTKVNLTYCRIISPINGRVGLRLVDPGNFVQTTDTTGLVVITTLNPINVIFSIPEDDIPQVLPQVFANKTITVIAYDRQQNTVLATGKLLTIDNQVDPTTGTVKLKAEFDNKENRLFPNQFVNIKLLVDTLPHATTVLTAAVFHGSQGDFVYLINSDNTVTAVPVKTGLTNGDDTVITEGLRAGQQVVIQGADKLSNGTKVKIYHERERSS